VYVARITPDNVIQMLQASNVPRIFDVLKIDIDSYDCDVLNAVLSSGLFEPQILFLEFNFDIAPGVLFVSLDLCELAWVAGGWLRSRQLLLLFHSSNIPIFPLSLSLSFSLSLSRTNDSLTQHNTHLYICSFI
jgi:hypothetical protein